MERQDQITFSSELERISHVEDTRTLQRICWFYAFFTEYLLDYVESPSVLIDDFSNWWNGGGEREAMMDIDEEEQVL